MSAEKRAIPVAAAGAVACAACCAAPIGAWLAAAGLGSALGVARFGAIGALAAAVPLTVVWRRRRRRPVDSPTAPVSAGR